MRNWSILPYSLWQSETKTSFHKKSTSRWTIIIVFGKMILILLRSYPFRDRVSFLEAAIDNVCTSDMVFVICYGICYFLVVFVTFFVVFVIFSLYLSIFTIMISDMENLISLDFLEFLTPFFRSPLPWATPRLWSRVQSTSIDLACRFYFMLSTYDSW